MNQARPPSKIVEDAAILSFLTAGTPCRRLAYLRRTEQRDLSRPGLVWLGGFRSSMRGIKAEHLDQYAAQTGRAFLRFDYFGHGASDGRLEEGTIGLWLEDCLAVIRGLIDGPQILMGSSMGGWLALLAARALKASGDADRLKGLILLAPAIDFTEALIFEKLPPAARAELFEKGLVLHTPADGEEPYPVTRALIEDGRKHLLLGGTVRTHCPVHILQGMQDTIVPWRHAMTVAEHLAADPASITLIKNGDHRLSRPEDLARLTAAVEAMEAA